MTERELKKLSRLELLEILLAQGREIERLRAEIAALEQRMAQDAPQAVIPEAEGADVPAVAAADVLAEAKVLLTQAETLSNETQIFCRELQSRTEAECAAAQEEAQRKVKEYWNEFSSWVREGRTIAEQEGRL